MKKILFQARSGARLLIVSLLIMSSHVFGYGVVNNSGSTAADSISIPFYALDSTGNMVTLTTGDSVFLMVFYPSGALAYEDSATYNASFITAKTRHGMSWYNWKAAVSTIDGTPVQGVYSYILTAKDNTGAALSTPHKGHFQLLTETDFNTSVEYIKDALDTLQSQDDWIATISKQNIIIDSLYAVLDSIQKYLDATISSRSTLIITDNIGINWGDIINPTFTQNLTNTTIKTVTGVTNTVGADVVSISGDVAAADNFETMLDGTGGQILNLRGLHIRGTTDNDTAIIAHSGGLWGYGASIKGLGLGSVGLEIDSDSGSYALKVSGKGGTWIKATGGNNSGMLIQGQGVGKGLAIDGGSNGGDGLDIYASGSGDALVVRAVGTGHAVYLNAVDASANDINLVNDGGEFSPQSIWDVGFGTSFTTGSMGDSLNNSTYVQGSASGLTVDDIWNEPQSGHTTAGTFGKYLDTEISGISSGSGVYSYSIQIYDSTIGQVIVGADVAVRNLNQTSLIAVGKADINGLAKFNLNADSLLVIVSAPSYIFNVFDTIVVSGSSIDTVYGMQFDPGTPSSPSLCRVYGHLYDLQGQPDEGATVTAYLPSGVVRYDSVIVSPFMVTATTDSSGYFYLDLIPSDSLIPSGIMYEFTISRKDGTILRQRLTIPDLSSWRLVW